MAVAGGDDGLPLWAVIALIVVGVLLLAAAVAVPCGLRACEQRRKARQRRSSEVKFREVRTGGDSSSHRIDYSVLSEMLAKAPELASQLASQVHV